MDLVHVTDLVPLEQARWQPGDGFLAGGTWLFSAPQPGLRRLVDLRAAGWPALTEGPAGLEIAATCTLGELARRPEPVFGWCVDALLGSFKVAHEATVGGNICLALPAAPMISLLAGLDAVALLVAADGSSRTLPVADLVLGPQLTALGAGEYLRSVTVADPAARVAYRRASLSTYGRSAAFVLGRRSGDGAVVTVTASVPRPVQVRFDTVPSAARAVAAVESAVAGAWYDDVHGHPAWRAAMTSRLVAEVVTELAD